MREKYIESEDRYLCCVCPVGSCNDERYSNEFCSEDQIEYEKNLGITQHFDDLHPNKRTPK
jgi:hypothetical protein